MTGRDVGRRTWQRASAGIGRAVTWVRADRTRIALAVAGALLWLGATTWFFAGRGARGPTARLAADALYYHVYLPSLAVDRDLDFTDEYRVTHNWYRFGTTPTGRPANVFGIGPAVFEAPLFAAGHVVARLGGWRADGFSRPEELFSLYASLLAGLGALPIAYRLARRRLRGRGALACAVAAVACGGPVIYYSIRQPGYAHPFATLFIAWLVERVDASFDGRGEPRGLRTWLGFGALLGAAALARPQLALWAAVLVPAAIDDIRRLRAAGSTGFSSRSAIQLALRWSAGALASLAMFTPQLLAWKAIYGEFYLVPQGEGFMRWDEPAWSETLFSSRNGLFAYAPLWALATIGLLAALRRHPRLAGSLLVGLALQTVANGAVWDWWAGGAFGGRRFDSGFIAFAFGFAFLVEPSSAPAGWRRHVSLGARATVWALAAVLVAGNLAWAGRHSAESVHIYGGRAARRVLTKEIPAPLGAVVGWLSSAATFPARLVFAIRWKAPPGAYDVVVGTHLLGELYPRLNSIQGKRREAISLVPDRLRMSGLETRDSEPRLIERNGATMTEPRARFLLGFNRRGPVRFELRAQAAPSATSRDLILYLNGEPLGRGELGDSPVSISGEAKRVHRGTNELVVEAPVGTAIRSLVVSSTVQADGRP